MKRYVYTGNRLSRSGRLLSRELNAIRIRLDGSNFVPMRDKVLINWGSSSIPFHWINHTGLILNSDVAVKTATNKLFFFQKMSDKEFENKAPRIPWWTTDKDKAKEQMKNERLIVAREVLTGHSGAGISICGGGDNLPDAPLYVEYVKKKDEYRCHFIRGTDTPFVQRKCRVGTEDNPNWLIRNLQGGFIYANTEEVVGQVPPDVLEQSRKAFNCSGLDFCAVDVLWNEHQGKAYVLEINTAPGLAGKTIQFYKEGLSKLC